MRCRLGIWRRADPGWPPGSESPRCTPRPASRPSRPTPGCGRQTDSLLLLPLVGSAFREGVAVACTSRAVLGRIPRNALNRRRKPIWSSRRRRIGGGGFSSKRSSERETQRVRTRCNPRRGCIDESLWAAPHNGPSSNAAGTFRIRINCRGVASRSASRWIRWWSRPLGGARASRSSMGRAAGTASASWRRSCSSRRRRLRSASWSLG